MAKMEKFKQLTEWLSQMAMLNIIWLLFALPIVTLIPATDALYEVMVNKSAGYESFTTLFRLFFVSFKRNFKGSYWLALPILCVGLFLFGDIMILKAITYQEPWFLIYKFFVYLASLFIGLVMLLGYSLAKREKAVSLRVYVLALKLALKHPIVILALVCSLFFLGVFVLRWPSLIYFFSASVICWLTTQAMMLIKSKPKNHVEN